MGGEETDVEELSRLVASPELRSDAVWALGFSGRMVVAEAALAWMHDADKTFSRLAGEAFSAITGLKLAGKFVREDESEGGEEPVPLEQEDLGADLGPRHEDLLPLPEPQAVEDWWKKERSAFERSRRYLHGRLFSLDRLLDMLEHAPMRRRHVLTLELAIRSRGQHWLETHAPIYRQQAWLAQSHAVPETSFRLGFNQLLTQG